MLRLRNRLKSGVVLDSDLQKACESSRAQIGPESKYYGELREDNGGQPITQLGDMRMAEHRFYQSARRLGFDRLFYAECRSAPDGLSTWQPLNCNALSNWRPNST